MVTKRLYTSGLLGLLSLCMAPTHMIADQVAAPLATTAVAQLIGPRAKAALALTTAIGLLFMCSEKARSVTTRATLNSILASLRMLAKLPLPAVIKKNLQEKIEHLETIYTTRAGGAYTSDDLRAAAKDFKEIIDAVKAAEFVAVWAGLLIATTK